MDGVRGDHIQVAPPLVVKREEIDEIVDFLIKSNVKYVLTNNFSLKRMEFENKEFKNTLEELGDGYYAEFSYAVVYENTIEHSEYIILHQDSKRNWFPH